MGGAVVERTVSQFSIRSDDWLKATKSRPASSHYSDTTWSAPKFFIQSYHWTKNIFFFFSFWLKRALCGNNQHTAGEKKKKTEGKRHDERRRVERKWDRSGKREPKRTSLSVRTTEAYFWRGNYRYECWAISLLLDYQSDMSPEWHSNSFQFLTSWLCRCSKGCSCFSWSPLKKNASFTFLFIPKLAPII